MRRSVLPLLLALLALFIAAPGGGPEGLARGAAGTVREVIDGDTVVLGDGREVRLVGIQAPKLPLGRPGFAKWPLADEARARLAALTLDKRVDLYHGGRRVDRHGRALAHLVDAEGRWMQGAMLEAGLARVYTFADNRALADRMLALEREARAAGRGIWADPYYRVRTPGETHGLIDSFQIVTGRIVSAAVVRGRGYLNFGPDWRTDFTVYVPPKARRLFEEEGIDLHALEGRRVRVRGWIDSYNGPEIVATHPEQIEILE